jgi:hypothetical protein
VGRNNPIAAQDAIMRGTLGEAVLDSRIDWGKVVETEAV